MKLLKLLLLRLLPQVSRGLLYTHNVLLLTVLEQRRQLQLRNSVPLQVEAQL